jgi:hypothetical protein
MLDPIASSSSCSGSTLGSAPDAPSASACPHAHQRAPPPPPAPLIYAQPIDAAALDLSLDERVAYLTDFLGFTSADADALARARPLVLELVPALVDSLFDKLFEFDITKKVRTRVPSVRGVGGADERW